MIARRALLSLSALVPVLAMTACGSEIVAQQQAGSGGGTAASSSNTVTSSHAVSVVASSSSGEMTTTVASSSSSSTGGPPLMPAPLPQVPNQGGHLLQHPKLVTIDYPGWKHDKEISDFGDWIVDSSWIKEVGADYGVSTGTHTHVTLKESAPSSASSADVQQRILDGIASGELPSDPTQPNDYLYMFFFPPETAITDLDPSSGCAAYGDTDTSAWHDAIDDARGKLSYAIMPTCTKEPLSSITLGASHELIEAATDALPLTEPAFQMPASSPWYVLGEVGDLCEIGSDAIVDGYSVARVWSNSHADGTQWPCLPAPSTPYFGTGTTKNAPFHVKPGSDLSIDLVGYGVFGSNWDVQTYPFYQTFDPNPTLDTTTFNVGVTGTLTVSAPANAKGSQSYLLILATRGAERSVWPIMIDAF